jgi:ferredoxin-NADP reductase
MKLTLTDKKQVLPDVTTFVFEPEQPLAWQAGQYMHYVLPHDSEDDRGHERWFTISSAPFEQHLQITTRHSEKSSSFKTKLFELPIGGTIEADGPEGDFVVTNPEEEFVFIAGGIGITPFRSILLDLDHRGLDIRGKLLYANRDDNFVFKQELDALAQKHPNFVIHYFTADERIDENAIRESTPDYMTPTFYVSGPQPMVEAFAKMLTDMGVPSTHQKHDDFPGYE